MKARWYILALVLGCTAFAAHAQAEVRDQRRTLIGSEILGRGGLVTFNVEHFLTPKFGLGAGILAAGNSDGGVFILPLYISFVPGDVHSVYTGAGLSIFNGTAFGSDSETFRTFTLSVGYQFHSSDGLFVRPLFTLMSAPDEGDSAFIWPGMTIGGSF